MSNKTGKGPTLAQMAQMGQYEKDAEMTKKMEGTEAGAIWSEIKDRPIEMFALPGQIVCMHCHPLSVEPNRLYLTTNSTAVLPSLENALGRNFVVERADRFIIVSRPPVSPIRQ